MKRFFFLCGLFALSLQSSAQLAQRRFRLVEHNVENLFDTLHAEGKQDVEFTPAGNYQWDSRRYWSKQGRLARLYAAVGGEVPADLIALCEVENDSVLYDLTRRTHLARLGYEYIGTSGPDVRGINVALLYQPLTFSPVSIDTIAVRLPAGKRPTRDILHVAGRLTTGDTLDVFVCHTPSRSGGRRASQPNREVAARILRHSTDSLFRLRQHPLIVCTGDFNDESKNRPLRRTLGATFAPEGSKRVKAERLYELRPLSARRDVDGTYSWRGRWYELDHIFVSGTLLSDTSPLRSERTCQILTFPFLLKEGDDGKRPAPFRTYLGTFYQGGISDHLPLCADFWY